MPSLLEVLSLGCEANRSFVKSMTSCEKQKNWIREMLTKQRKGERETYVCEENNHCVLYTHLQVFVEFLEIFIFRICR